MKQILLLTVILFYAGCASKNEKKMEKSFEQMTRAGTSLQKTEKIKIVKKNEVKILLTASYLNGEESLNDKKEKVREKFIVGLYQAGDSNYTGLINPDQNLTINLQYPKSDKKFTRKERLKRKKGIDRLPLLVQKLPANDPKLKNIPMVNIWSDYYYVEFPHTKREQFTLTYQNRIYGSKVVKKKKKSAKKKETELKKNTKSKKSVTESKVKKSSVQGKKNTEKKTGPDAGKKDAKSKDKKTKDETVETVQYIKYRMNFSKKGKYLYRGNVKMFR